MATPRAKHTVRPKIINLRLKQASRQLRNFFFKSGGQYVVTTCYRTWSQSFEMRHPCFELGTKAIIIDLFIGIFNSYSPF